ncbi:discoidin domain-containing protein [Clostridioides sp. ES-S-0108-01]|uniref:discoidin domain-containing protein n=1 Tax=Clostridioides sp. ES-S-0108-01 TaxID=2770773 RepID=UPI001D0CD741|nr:discoidin domain-containing protein [Clostridioides sp. ES-S-0108-01]UDN49972.1 discoidin domain-containing protein [Clostridioides sp. ES-S-0107-01]
MASVGDALPQPEEGWKRYNDDCINIFYSELYKRVPMSSCYGGTGTYVKNVPYDETDINFSFIGSKVRIMCDVCSDRSDLIDINLDGKVEQFSTRIGNTWNFSKIVYEKLDLDDKLHNIKISINKNSVVVYFFFDCIDIDEGGHILSPIESILTQRTLIEDMEIGDIVSCRYTATTSGKLGEFSELGICTCEEIPRNVSSPTPDGKFFFVKVDDNKLIADRNIQNNISWNEINKSDIDFFYREKVFPIKDCESDETEEYILKASSIYDKYYAFHAFQNGDLVWHSELYNYPHILQITFKKNPRRINSYRLHFRNDAQLPQPATEWTIEASNDELTWIILHKVKESTVPIYNQVNNYIFKNENFYNHYRIKITNSSSTTGSVAIKKLDFFYKKCSLCLPNGGVAYNDDITVSFPKKALTSNEDDDYILEQSSTYSTGFLAYLVFNKTNIDSDDCWHSNSEANPYIKVSSKKEKISACGFILTNRNCPGSSNLQPLVLYMEVMIIQLSKRYMKLKISHQPIKQLRIITLIRKLNIYTTNLILQE